MESRIGTYQKALGTARKKVGPADSALPDERAKTEADYTFFLIPRFPARARRRATGIRSLLPVHAAHREAGPLADEALDRLRLREGDDPELGELRRGLGVIVAAARLDEPLGGIDPLRRVTRLTGEQAHSD